MTIELTALTVCGLVMILSILAQGTYLDLNAGLKYVFSSRDEPNPNHGVTSQRLDRNVRNQLEGLAMFLPLILTAHLADIHNNWISYSAAVYAATRALFPITYVLGLVPWRTMTWGAGLFSLFTMIYGIIIGVS